MKHLTLTLLMAVMAITVGCKSTSEFAPVVLTNGNHRVDTVNSQSKKAGDAHQVVSREFAPALTDEQVASVTIDGKPQASSESENAEDTAPVVLDPAIVAELKKPKLVAVDVRVDTGPGWGHDVAGGIASGVAGGVAGGVTGGIVGAAAGGGGDVVNNLTSISGATASAKIEPKP